MQLSVGLLNLCYAAVQECSQQAVQPPVPPAFLPFALVGAVASLSSCKHCAHHACVHCNIVAALRLPPPCREDLVNALNKLYDRREQIDHIIIETTGLANPGPIVSSFYMDRWAVGLWTAIVCLLDNVLCPTFQCTGLAWHS
jgi:hypothetical protein